MSAAFCGGVGRYIRARYASCRVRMGPSPSIRMFPAYGLSESALLIMALCVVHPLQDLAHRVQIGFVIPVNGKMPTFLDWG